MDGSKLIQQMKLLCQKMNSKILKNRRKSTKKAKSISNNFLKEGKLDASSDGFKMLAKDSMDRFT